MVAQCGPLGEFHDLNVEDDDISECPTVIISAKQMCLALGAHAHLGRHGDVHTHAASNTTSLFDVIEPILFSKVFWGALASPKWVVMLSRTSRTLARRTGGSICDRRRDTSPWIMPSMEMWREFALSAMIETAAHVRPDPDSRAVADAIRLSPCESSVLEGCQALLTMMPNCVGEAYQRARNEDGEEWSKMENAYEKIGETDGGISAVLNGMSKWPKSAGVQACGCRFLRLAGRVENNMVKIAEADGISIVLRALKTHRDNADVQHYGCWALMNLAYNTSNRIKIAAEDGIQVFLDSLDRHPTHTGVQELGVWGLSNLACSDENNGLIADKHGGAYAIRAMNQHPKSTAIQEGGINILLRLNWSSSNEHVREETRDHGGLGAIKRAMKSHEASHAIQTKGFALLERIEIY